GRMMRNLILLAIFGVYLQVVKCTPRSPLFGSIAACTTVSTSGLSAASIHYLCVYECKLHQTNTFQRLANLVKLYLGHNSRLQNEQYGFVGLSNLRTLSLYNCDLTETVLQGDYLRPLVSLEMLDLYGNHMKIIQPALFFVNMIDFQELNVTLNRMTCICEEDLLGFQGKQFRLLDLSSIQLNSMTQYGFDWKICRNPLRNMSMEILDLSSNGFNVDKAKQFFNTIRGTKIHHLILEHSTMGK
ncbi:unnamed protein product, partial [Coregonus sp. 'balchen']